MCVVSMVHDHFRDRFAPWIPSQPYEFVPFTPVIPATDWNKIFEEAAKFQEAIRAAQVVDRLTKQPDCIDPEKAKLEQRVAELEEIVRKLIAATPQPTPP